MEVFEKMFFVHKSVYLFTFSAKSIFIYYLLGVSARVRAWTCVRVGVDIDIDKRMDGKMPNACVFAVFACVCVRAFAWVRTCVRKREGYVHARTHAHTHTQTLIYIYIYI